MEMYRTANPGMTVRPRPWPRGVVSSTEFESNGIFRGLDFIRNPQTPFWNFQTKEMQQEMRLTLRFNRMNSVRVEYALWSIEGPVPLELKSILPSIHRCPAKPAQK